MAHTIFLVDSAGLEVYISDPAHCLPGGKEQKVELEMILNTVSASVRFTCTKETWARSKYETDMTVANSEA